LYDGLIEELVDLLTVKDTSTTTYQLSWSAIMVNCLSKCVDRLIDQSTDPFPHQFATSLFSFLEDTLMNVAALKVQPLTQPSFKTGLTSKISTTQVFFKFF